MSDINDLKTQIKNRLEELIIKGETYVETTIKIKKEFEKYYESIKEYIVDWYIRMELYIEKNKNKKKKKMI